MTDGVRSDERSLVSAAQNGDRAAFETLVRRYADPVYGHALRFFGDRQAAEDASQEVFVKVYRSLSGFDGRAAFSTWLFRVTRNVCLDMTRRAARRPVPVDPVDLTAAHTSHATVGSLALAATPDFSEGLALAAALETALGRLPADDRDAFNAVALFGLGYAEAATALGVPAGTVKSRVFRARRALVSALGLAKGGA